MLADEISEPPDPFPAFVLGVRYQIHGIPSSPVNDRETTDVVVLVVVHDVFPESFCVGALSHFFHWTDRNWVCKEQRGSNFPWRFFGNDLSFEKLSAKVRYKINALSTRDFYHWEIGQVDFFQSKSSPKGDGPSMATLNSYRTVPCSQAEKTGEL